MWAKEFHNLYYAGVSEEGLPPSLSIPNNYRAKGDKHQSDIKMTKGKQRVKNDFAPQMWIDYFILWFGLV